MSKESDLQQWVLEIKPEVKEFIKHQKGKTPGFFHYSYSADAASEKTGWGLAPSCFAVKILGMLGELERMDQDEKEAWIGFLTRFIHKDGLIYDDWVLRHSFKNRLIRAVIFRNWQNLTGAQTKWAETRQAMAALEMLGKPYIFPARALPKAKKAVENYFSKLTWRRDPWSAASHVSHLLFFLKKSDLDSGQKEELIETTLHELKNFEAEDGSWHRNIKLSPRLRLNAAMKILTGLAVIDRMDQLRQPERLIDLALSSSSDEEACSTIDIVYVLHWCVKKTDYRASEVKLFLLKRLKMYREHWHFEQGGFSFYKKSAGTHYYGARVSQGKNEADLHGTVLLLWGITMIVEMLGWNEELGFKLPVT